MGDALKLTGKGLATSVHSSALALLHALRMGLPMETAQSLNQARATYPGGVSELDAALHLMQPPGKELEVGNWRYSSKAGAKHPPHLAWSDHSGVKRREVKCCSGRQPGAPPSCRPPTRPIAGPTHTCAPPSRGPGAPPIGSRHSGKSAWAPPCSCLLSQPAGTRGGSSETPQLSSIGQRPCPALPALEARDGVHTFLRTQEVSPVSGVHLVRLPFATPDDPRGPRALSPAPDWVLWPNVCAEWLASLAAQCRWMAIGP